MAPRLSCADLRLPLAMRRLDSPHEPRDRSLAAQPPSAVTARRYATFFDVWLDRIHYRVALR